MHRPLKIAVVAAFVATIGVGAGAVIADSPGACLPFGRDMRVVAGQKLDRLHEQLKLAPEQETAWADYRHAVQAQAGKADEHWRNWREANPAPTAIERLERGRQGLDERRQALEEITNATRRFYGTLSTEQQRRFDDLTRQFAPGGFGRHGHHHGGA